MAQKEIRVGIVGADVKASWAKVSHVPAINKLPGLLARRNSEMFSTLCQHPASSLRSFKKRALGVGHIPDIPRRLFQ